jgi:hypothetical protein
VAAVLAFASAAVTAYWLVDGTIGLDTVGGGIEEQARERTPLALTALAVTLVAKLGAGGLALALALVPRVGRRAGARGGARPPRAQGIRRLGSSIARDSRLQLALDASATIVCSGGMQRKL